MDLAKQFLRGLWRLALLIGVIGGSVRLMQTFESMKYIVLILALAPVFFLVCLVLGYDE